MDEKQETLNALLKGEDFQELDAEGTLAFRAAFFGGDFDSVSVPDLDDYFRNGLEEERHALDSIIATLERVGGAEKSYVERLEKKEFFGNETLEMWLRFYGLEKESVERFAELVAASETARSVVRKLVYCFSVVGCDEDEGKQVGLYRVFTSFTLDAGSSLGKSSRADSFYLDNVYVPSSDDFPFLLPPLFDEVTALQRELDGAKQAFKQKCEDSLLYVGFFGTAYCAHRSAHKGADAINDEIQEFHRIYSRAFDDELAYPLFDGLTGEADSALYRLEMKGALESLK